MDPWPRTGFGIDPRRCDGLVERRAFGAERSLRRYLGRYEASSLALNEGIVRYRGSVRDGFAERLLLVSGLR